MIKVFAFDCFGTVFNMDGIPSEEIRDYVAHVRAENFAPYDFPESWYTLDAHPDSAVGIESLQFQGFKCVALSNGSVDLIDKISINNGIHWDHIVDLVAHKVYKPNRNAYFTIKKDLGTEPEETVMITANPSFGDIEGAYSVGMHAKIIRRPYHTKNIASLALDQIDFFDGCKDYEYSNYFNKISIFPPRKGRDAL